MSRLQKEVQEKTVQLQTTEQRMRKTQQTLSDAQLAAQDFEMVRKVQFIHIAPCESFSPALRCLSVFMFQQNSTLRSRLENAIGENSEINRELSSAR